MRGLMNRIVLSVLLMWNLHEWRAGIFRRHDWVLKGKLGLYAPLVHGGFFSNSLIVHTCGAGALSCEYPSAGVSCPLNCSGV